MSEEISLYQELATNTWPPKLILNQNGWKVRISEGVTKRANSVSPIRYTGNSLIEDIIQVEKIYQKESLPPIFQLADLFEPPELMDTLISSGYESIDETLVMSVDITEMNTAPEAVGYEFLHLEEDIEEWISAFKSLREDRTEDIEGIKQIIERATKSNVCFYIAKKEEEYVAIGLTISEGNYMGVFNMYTHPEHRRKGIAQSIISMMIEWGEINLIDEVFLQVEADNPGAINLYEKFGFKEKYRYRYLIKNSHS